MNHKNRILSDVASFYTGNHFNDVLNNQSRRKRLNQINIIRERYPDLHRYLKIFNNRNGSKVLEAGCGTGWMTYSILRHYRQLCLLSIDQSQYAIEKTYDLCNSLVNKPLLQACNIFEMPYVASFDLIVSIGVLHHTHSAFEAIELLSKSLNQGGVMYLGLYHQPSRQVFFDFLGVSSDNIAETRDRFKLLFGDGIDDVHLDTWFKDQCLHVHESQHTIAEVWEKANKLGLRLCSTSLNKFAHNRSYTKDYCSSLDSTYKDYVAKEIYNHQRFMPGFFTVLLKKD